MNWWIFNAKLGDKSFFIQERENITKPREMKQHQIHQGCSSPLQVNDSHKREKVAIFISHLLHSPPFSATLIFIDVPQLLLHHDIPVYLHYSALNLISSIFPWYNPHVPHLFSSTLAQDGAGDCVAAMCRILGRTCALGHTSDSATESLDDDRCWM